MIATTASLRMLAAVLRTLGLLTLQSSQTMLEAEHTKDTAILFTCIIVSVLQNPDTHCSMSTADGALNSVDAALSLRQQQDSE